MGIRLMAYPGITIGSPCVEPKAELISKNSSNKKASRLLVTVVNLGCNFQDIDTICCYVEEFWDLWC